MKKTNKVNPLTFFNNANQARQNVVKKSLKKAQDGIQTNGDPEDMMINKPGYGAKTTRNPLAPYAGMMNPTTTMQDLARTQMENVNAVNAANTSNALSARSAALQGKTASEAKDRLQSIGRSYKKGGSVKRKK